jgi:hypothetical protein
LIDNLIFDACRFMHGACHLAHGKLRAAMGQSPVLALALFPVQQAVFRAATILFEIGQAAHKRRIGA